MLVAIPTVNGVGQNLEGGLDGKAENATRISDQCG